MCEVRIESYPSQDIIWIAARLIRHEPCGVSIVSVSQNHIDHQIGVDRSTLRKMQSQPTPLYQQLIRI